MKKQSEKDRSTTDSPLDIRPDIAADEAWRAAQPKSTVRDFDTEATSRWLESYPSTKRRGRNR